jgi:hypothetical protein
MMVGSRLAQLFAPASAVHAPDSDAAPEAPVIRPRLNRRMPADVIGNAASETWETDRDPDQRVAAPSAPLPSAERKHDSSSTSRALSERVHVEREIVVPSIEPRVRVDDVTHVPERPRVAPAGPPVIAPQADRPRALPSSDTRPLSSSPAAASRDDRRESRASRPALPNDHSREADDITAPRARPGLPPEVSPQGRAQRDRGPDLPRTETPPAISRRRVASARSDVATGQRPGKRGDLAPAPRATVTPITPEIEGAREVKPSAPAIEPPPRVTERAPSPVASSDVPCAAALAVRLEPSSDTPPRATAAPRPDLRHDVSIRISRVEIVAATSKPPVARPPRRPLRRTRARRHQIEPRLPIPPETR